MSNPTSTNAALWNKNHFEASFLVHRPSGKTKRKRAASRGDWSLFVFGFGVFGFWVYEAPFGFDTLGKNQIGYALFGLAVYPVERVDIYLSHRN